MNNMYDPYNNSNSNNNSGSFNPFGGIGSQSGGNPLNNLFNQNGGNPLNNLGNQNSSNPLNNLFGQNAGNPLDNMFGRSNSNPVNNFGSRPDFNASDNHNGFNPNYGGNAQYSNAVYSSDLTPKTPKNTTVPFMISSILIIITGIMYFFLDFLRKALGVVNSGKHTVRSFFNHDFYGAYNGAKGTVSSVYNVLNHSVCMLTLVQVVTGIVGIIFVIVFTSKKFEGSTSLAKIIPFFCGVVALITSIVYAILLIAAHTPFFLWLIMAAVMFFTPIFFTKNALNFYKS